MTSGQFYLARAASQPFSCSLSVERFKHFCWKSLTAFQTVTLKAFPALKQYDCWW